MTKEILIPKLKDDSLTAQLFVLYHSLKQLSTKEAGLFNLSNLEWVCPFLILPLSAYINNTKSDYFIENTHKIKSYLNTIGFPQGVNSIFQLQKLENYIPIGVLERHNKNREKLENCFLEIIHKILNDSKGAESAIYYPIVELTGNIFEHSRQDKGYIFGQFYPTKKYLDICITDTGIGLAKTYQEVSGSNISDKDAIIKAMEGLSTKLTKEQGYGIRTSKQVVCQALGGGFILLSGNSVFISTGDKEFITTLNDFYWQGVIIAYRIPKPSGTIDITPYLE